MKATAGAFGICMTSIPQLLHVAGLFILTAIAEIVGCFLPYYWLRVVDGVRLSATDWLGAGIAMAGMSVVVIGWSET